MPYYADRVKDMTVSIGTGAVVLSGTPPTGFQSFATAFGTSGRRVSYCIALGAEWEVGKGTFDGTMGLTREQVRSSSNGGALVNFSAGTKDVFVTIPAEHTDNANLGNIYALARGFVLP